MPWRPSDPRRCVPRGVLDCANPDALARACQIGRWCVPEIGDHSNGRWNSKDRLNFIFFQNADPAHADPLSARREPQVLNGANSAEQIHEKASPGWRGRSAPDETRGVDIDCSWQRNTGAAFHTASNQPSAGLLTRDPPSRMPSQSFDQWPLFARSPSQRWARRGVAPRSRLSRR